MAGVALTLALILAVAGMSHSTSREEWLQWKLQHGKAYASDEEEDMRLRVWRHNYRLIVAHNARNLSYTLALNHFADLVSYSQQRVVTIILVFLLLSILPAD